MGKSATVVLITVKFYSQGLLSHFRANFQQPTKAFKYSDLQCKRRVYMEVVANLNNQ
jgi:hypothetical protein